MGVGGPVLYFDGTAWSSTLGGLSFSGVWGSSGSDVFAVGDLAAILHYGL